MPDPNLVVSLLTPEEAPQYMRIRHKAFEHDINKIFYFNAPASEKTLNHVIEKIREDIAKGIIFLKCVDTATGEIIAGARWTYRAPKDPNAKERTLEEVEEEMKIGEPYIESDPDLYRAFYTLLNNNRLEIMGRRPFYSLDTLVTHPNHHRRGAGGLLLAYGFKMVDEAGVEAYLESSIMGRPLYERYGFEPVKDISLDLRSWSGNGQIEWTLMKRKAAASH